MERTVQDIDREIAALEAKYNEVDCRVFPIGC